jgi:hypothetical protein
VHRRWRAYTRHWRPPMWTAALADLPELWLQPELAATLTVRLTRADRERIERRARELGVPPGKLARAVLRKVLLETGDEAAANP